MVGNLVAKMATWRRAEPGELHAATRVVRRPVDGRICRNEGVAYAGHLSFIQSCIMFHDSASAPYVAAAIFCAAIS
jgi:hypothetical protein